jgi:hypothetical protein
MDKIENNGMSKYDLSTYRQLLKRVVYFENKVDFYLHIDKVKSEYFQDQLNQVELKIKKFLKDVD